MVAVETLRLTLVRAPEDDASFSPGYQVELRQFYNLVRAEGTQISAIAFTKDRVGDGGGLMGEFVVPLAQVIGPVLGRAAIAWLQGRTGRTMRLMAGDLEVDANTQAKFDAFLTQATALRLRQPLPELDYK